MDVEACHALFRHGETRDDDGKSKVCVGRIVAPQRRKFSKSISPPFRTD